MFDPLSSVPADCNYAAMRLIGSTSLGLMVLALEAWLRMPVRPLLDSVMPQVQARAVALGSVVRGFLS